MRRLFPFPVALVLLMVAALPAWGQDWTIAVDVPMGSTFFLTEDGRPVEYDTEDTEGGILRVTTPYHVGFGYESYSFVLRPDEDFSIRVSAELIDLFVEIPITGWLAISPGVAWGTGKFETDAGDIEAIFEPINLWQFFGVIAVRMPWGLQVRLGYQEARGRFVQRDRSQTPIEVHAADLKMTLTTLGFGYTF